MVTLDKIKNKLQKPQIFDLDWYLKNSSDIDSNILTNINGTTFVINVLKNVYLISNYGFLLNKTLRVINSSDSDLTNSIKTFLSTTENSLDIEKRQGEYLSLLGEGNILLDNWLFECLLKVMVAELSGFKGFYIVPSINGFIKNSFEILGINVSRLITDKNIFVEKLYVIKNLDKEQYSVILRVLRDNIVNYINILNSNVNYERIYITKRSYQSVDNHFDVLELKKILKEYSIKTIFEEDLTLKERIEIISKSKCLITNLPSSYFYSLFMKENSILIDLCNPIFIKDTYLIPSLELTNHKFYRISLPHYEAMNYQSGFNYTSSIEILKIYLSRLF